MALLSQDPIEALTAAIRAGDAPAVRAVFARFPDLKDYIDEPLPNYSFDAPAILAAVHTEKRDVIDAVLQAGADINARSRWWAGSYGVLDTANRDLAEYLISRGAVVDIHAAARLGRIDRVRELLAGNPKLVHARGGDGQFPLHFAATAEIAELLLEHGAEIDALDLDHESTAAQYMAGVRDYMDSQGTYRHDVARFLIARGAKTDILMAAAVGEFAVVERILKDDPEAVEVTVSERYFPMRDPRAGGSIYIFGFGRNKSPHSLARQFGHGEVFNLLMAGSPAWLRVVETALAGDEAGMEGIVRDHPDFLAELTPERAARIVAAALDGNTRTVEMLLDRGWPVNAVSDHRQTALHFSSWIGNLPMVRVLLAHKAPVNVFETEYGGSPLAWALHGSLNSWARQKGDYPGVVEALLAAGAEIPKPERPLEASAPVLEILERQEPR